MLIKLMLGVRQFQGESFQRMRGIFEQLSLGQNPEILFITCSDSRLMPNLLTQANPGELFVIRNVGNIIPPAHVPSSEAAGLIFALNELHELKDIIICGHSHCGAMKGLLNPQFKERHPEIGSWLSHSNSVLKTINASHKFSDKDIKAKIDLATKLNILAQMEHLKSYPIIAEKLRRNELTIHGWLYEFEKGEVLVYDHQSKDFVSFEKALEHAIYARRDKLIEQIAMNYLETLTHPKTAKEYVDLMHFFDLLEDNLLPIWANIKGSVALELWHEIGGLYSSSDDPQFLTLLNQGEHLKLSNLKLFQKNILESYGYQRYNSQMIRNSLFFKKLDPLTTPNIPNEYLTPQP